MSDDCAIELSGGQDAPIPALRDAERDSGNRKLFGPTEVHTFGPRLAEDRAAKQATLPHGQERPGGFPEDKVVRTFEERQEFPTGKFPKTDAGPIPSTREQSAVCTDGRADIGPF